MTSRINDRLVFRQTQGQVVGYPEELRLGPVNETLLRQIAELSGGRFDPPAPDVFSTPSRPAVRPVPLWRWLVTLALPLLLLDIALRRLDLVGFRGG